jgi:hypothetical protein
VNGKILNETLRAELKEIVREALFEYNDHNPRSEPDRLLMPKEAAAILGVDVRWLYRHAPKLQFTRCINRKTLRFSEAGLRRWVEAKKPGPR